MWEEFYFKISKASAEMVKKYQGSLQVSRRRSGSRALSLDVGEKNLRNFSQESNTTGIREISQSRKIVDAAPMNQFPSYTPDVETPRRRKRFGLLRARWGSWDWAEEMFCNVTWRLPQAPWIGWGPCVRATWGYHARGAIPPVVEPNVLLWVLTLEKKENAFDSSEIKEAMDLCLLLAKAVLPSAIECDIWQVEGRVSLSNTRKRIGCSACDLRRLSATINELKSIGLIRCREFANSLFWVILSTGKEMKFNF